VQTRSGFITGISLLIIFALIPLWGTISNSLASDGDQVVATVNEEPIHHTQLDPLIAEYKRQTKKRQVNTQEKAQLLKNLIRRNLILQQDFARRLRESKEISTQIKKYEDKLVLQGYIKHHVTDFLTVSEEESKRYYLNNLHQFNTPPKVKASHILLRTKTEAKLVLEKLQAGENFSELAKQYSIDLPMALEGGSMGTIAKGKAMPQLEKVLFILDEGQFSDIVQTQFGCHILRVDEKITDQYIPYEEVEERIEAILKREKESEAYNEMTQKLEKDADITIYENRL
jgi:parvulin-like peptidyl-prolyl isomerase